MLLAADARACASAADCNADAAKLHPQRPKSELPRLEVAPPDDRQIVCITLETNMLFARRLPRMCAMPALAACAKAETWARTGTNYAAQFKQRRLQAGHQGYRG